MLAARLPVSGMAEPCDRHAFPSVDTERTSPEELSGVRGDAVEKVVPLDMARIGWEPVAEYEGMLIPCEAARVGLLSDAFLATSAARTPIAEK